MGTARLRQFVLGVSCAVVWAAVCARPAAAMPDIMPASQVRAGMKGVAKSVFRGTKVETFGITVLGVLEKMDLGGGDLIIIRVDDGPVVKQRLGIVGGMSGSPVYIQGKLIGAIAWAVTFSSLPIAGVTPITQMMEAYQPGWSGSAKEPAGAWRGDPITIAGRTFTRFAVAHDGVAAAAGDANTMVFRPLATPLMVSGLGPAGTRNLARLLEPHSLVPVPGPGPVGKPLSVNLEPGSAVGVQLVSGDIDISAVGTLTYIDGDRAIAFGHSMIGLGTTDLPLTTAYVHGVWPSAEMSFKLASPISPVGHWTEDRMWSVGGTIGAQADMLPATFRVTDGDRKVSRAYQLSIFRDRDWTGYLLLGTLSGALSAAVSDYAAERGSQRIGFKVEFDGLPPLERENTFAVEPMPAVLEFFASFSPYALSPLGELYQVLDLANSNPFEPVRINSVDVQLEASSDRLSATLEAVRPLKRIVRPGEEVGLEVAIRPVGQEMVTRTIAVRIPEHLPRGKVQIGVAGGQSARGLARSMQIEHAKPKSVGQLLDRIRERAANDDLVVELILPTVGLQLDGARLPNLPDSVLEILQTSSASGIEVLRDHRATVERCPWVMSGVKMVTLFIDSDEKNKTGEAATPGTAFPGRGGWSDIFMTGMWFGDEYGYDYESTWRRALASPIAPLLWPDRLRALAADEDTGIEMPPMPSWEELEALSEQGLDYESSVSDLGPGAAKPGKKTKAIARPPGIWVEQTEKDFAKGKLTNAAVSDDGTVRIWPEMDSIEAPTDLCLWAQARGGDGTVYLGAWGSGTIYRPNGDGKLDAFAVTDAEAITAMAMAPDGTLYTAGHPGGKIQRINAEGQVSDLCHLDGDYVWAMAFDAAGDLWAAAGSPAGVFRIDSKGEATCLFRPPDRHAIALVAAPQGGVYVGTYPQGRVYRVKPSGVAQGVFEAPSAAVESLAIDQQGNLYVGTSPTAFVYQIAPDGIVTELLKAREKHVMALAVDGLGRVHAAVGQKGKLYCIAPDHSVSSHEEKGVSAFTSLTIADEAVSLCGVGATRVMTGRLDGRVEGEYTSSVHDAAAPARWGRVSWLATDGDGKVELFTRSGNTMLPDETWSNWAPAQVDGDSAPITSPAARYIQYQVRIGSDHGDQAPVLQRVELIYMSKNQPPTLAIKSPGGGEVWSGKRKVRWSADDPDKDKLTYSVFYSGDQGESWNEIKGKTEESTAMETTEGGEPPTEEETPNSEEPSTDGSGQSNALRSVQRTAARSAGRAALRPAFDGDFDSDFGDMSGYDESGDEFSTDETDTGSEGFDSMFADSGSTLGSNDMEWDTSSVADGSYLLKVIATDKDANPGDPLTVERISNPVRVDNTPPTVARRMGEHLLTPPRSLVITDTASRVASVEYRVDREKWHAAAAADGVFDGQSETIAIDPGALLAGHHVIQLRMRDGANNETTEKIRYFLARVPQTTPE